MSFAAKHLPEVLMAPIIADSPRWYAVYTYPRHEKNVAEQLESKSVEAFLPTFASRRQWKDRRVVISCPLFPCYVFARISLGERIKIVGTPSVVHLVSFNGTPAAISDQEIESVRLCVRGGATLEPHPVPEVGERVRVRSGAFEGVEGIVVNRKNGCKVVISIGLINQGVALEIDSRHLEPFHPAAGAGLLPGYSRDARLCQIHN